MLSYPITYDTLDGETVTEEYLFHLTRNELLDLSDEDLGEKINAAVEKGDAGTVLRLFRKIILGAVGKKSEDGKRFVKTDEYRTEFEQSEAFDVLVFELATEEGKGDYFVKGILPKDIMLKLGSNAQESLPWAK